jgi:hypothetical protein
MPRARTVLAGALDGLIHTRAAGPVFSFLNQLTVDAKNVVSVEAGHWWFTVNAVCG